MTASSKGVAWAVWSPPLGPALLLYYSLDGTEVFSREVTSTDLGPKVTSVDGLVSVGQDVFVSGTVRSDVFGGQAAFLSKHDGGGRPAWMLQPESTSVTLQMLLTTDGTDLFTLHAPYTTASCTDTVQGGITKCELDPNKPGADLRVRRYEAERGVLLGEIVLDVVLTPESARSLAVGGSPQRTYVGLPANGNVPPLAVFDASGALIDNHTVGLSPGPVWSAGVWLSYSEGLFALSRVKDKAPYDAYPVFSVPSDAPPTLIKSFGSYQTPVTLNDIVATRDGVYVVGRRKIDGTSGQFGGWAAFLSADGQVQEELGPEGFEDETFLEVALSPHGEVFIGGIAEARQGRSPLLFVLPWSK